MYGNCVNFLFCIIAGESVSLQCENKLLELTGYYGTVFSDAQPVRSIIVYCL